MNIINDTFNLHNDDKYMKVTFKTKLIGVVWLLILADSCEF